MTITRKDLLSCVYSSNHVPKHLSLHKEQSNQFQRFPSYTAAVLSEIIACVNVSLSPQRWKFRVSIENLETGADRETIRREQIMRCPVACGISEEISIANVSR